MSSPTGTNGDRLRKQFRRLTRWVEALFALVLISFLVAYSEDRSRHALSERNCHATRSLAMIEKRFIDRQEAQTQNVLSSGVTFGLTPEQLKAAILASKLSQARFVAELEDLAHRNC